ncbi:dermonecrotic toxin domain-containing protein [Pseudomonas sp. BE134]|uniref:dermonecrotic toxin domain-containing protein n=1 Tax=Pseudomonas sp. BE134 TaxID=2817843 RepID=UPI002856DAF3|nr:DUF6543 domain-containing protein [Pseudomonas sp. BE134]MDR6927514.1 hypothetical protein [Pseudomonas sp. BE134]
MASAVPAWLVNASPERREAVKNAALVLPDWYQAASPAQRQALNASFVASVTSQTLLDKTMSRLQDIDAFAQPLLVKALKDQFAVELDVTKTFLQLKKPLEMGILDIEVGTFEVLKLPLLQAALHNFEAQECAPAYYHSSSGFVVESTPGQFSEVPTALTVMQYLKLCRELDIGAKYQAYLKDFLQPSSPVAEAVLRKRFVDSQKAAMRAAAELALLKKDIEPKDYSMILSVIDGELNPKIDNTPVWICDLVLMKKRMTGCVLFHICEKYRYSDDILLYIPHDPQHPLKRYKGREMEATLKRLFMASDASPPANGGPTAYQRFFSQFVAYADRPYYFSQFTRKAADAPPDRLAPLRSPLWKAIEVLPPFFSAFYQLNELPPESPSRQEPVDELYLPIKGYRQHGFWGPNVDPWVDLYEQSRNKILADARSHAVPSADVDARVRAEKMARLLNIGMLVLNAASMFVPVLGEVMIGVMAGQILYETFEGAIEWSEGDRNAAWAHLTDVVENLALIAVLHWAGKGLGKLAAVKPEPVVEALKPVVRGHPATAARLLEPARARTSGFVGSQATGRLRVSSPNRARNSGRAGDGWASALAQRPAR